MQTKVGGVKKISIQLLTIWVAFGSFKEILKNKKICIFLLFVEVELREAVCQILVFVYNQPPPRCLSMEMIRQRQTKVINSALIGNLGKSSELQVK